LTAKHRTLEKDIDKVVTIFIVTIGSRKDAIPADVNHERWYFLTKFLRKSGEVWEKSCS
jgi:hypothetical protein